MNEEVLPLTPNPNKPQPHPMIAQLSTDIQTALAAALTATNETPVSKRLKRLQAGLESGEISGTLNGDWVMQCYQAQMSEGVDNPIITKKDVGNKAIILTLTEMRTICSLTYFDSTLEDMIVIDDQAMEDGNTEIVIVFPSEVA